jgi:DNA-3-methyladenine glycosylase
MSQEISKLSYDFYNRHCVDVAQDLIGETLIFGNFRGIITETEAYRGEDDEASHAFKGRTPRSGIMFGEPGYSYIYLIYGMYYCLNIVTESEGQAAAVLIRGLQLPEISLNGPGKICKYLGISKVHHGLPLISSEDFYVAEGISLPYIATPRIGIRKATHKLWRFLAI